MLRFFAYLSGTLLIVGGVYTINPGIKYGWALLISAILMIVLYKLLNSRAVQDLYSPIDHYKEYRSPVEIMEAAALLQDHKTGRDATSGGDVYITQDVYECDYSVHLNAKTLLNSNDPKIVVHDERTNPDVEIYW